jgi:hypothetical protein
MTDERVALQVYSIIQKDAETEGDFRKYGMNF